MKRILRFPLLLFIFLTVSPFLQAQNPIEKLQKDLENYFSVPREVAYLHLSKSVLLQGEQIGIAAYVVNKSNLNPSATTSNLYVQIRNAENQIVEQGVLLVEDGKADVVFDIDSKFVPGDYTITAFTNWMRNFDEVNYFSEKIKILESDVVFPTPGSNLYPEIDAQFLPESGHLLQGIFNQVGVIIRDHNGNGLSNATLKILDSRNRVIENLKLNEFGIGKFLFKPGRDEIYKAEVVYQSKVIPVGFNIKTEEHGVILFATRRNEDFLLAVKTNTQSLTKLNNSSFILAVQGRSTLETFDLQFEGREDIPVILDLDNMDPGVNIITLFDDQLQPLAERLIFNHKGLPIGSMRPMQLRTKSDSLEVKLSFNNKLNTRLSATILPKNTLSYKRNHNIISYNLLQPFLNGSIENGEWYFENIDNKKKQELDNLLLTQGWSSYDWNSIFNSENKIIYESENYLGFEARIHNDDFLKNDQRYVVHANSINPIDYFIVPKGNNKFIFEGFKAFEGENLVISHINKKNDLFPAGLSIRFFPHQIPHFESKVPVISPKVQPAESRAMITESAFNYGFENIEQLDEVTLEHKIDGILERERKLNKSAFSTTYVLKEGDLLMHRSLADYLRSKNLVVSEELGGFKVYARGEEMAIFLDRQRISDHSMFYGYPLQSIDYIEIDRSGLGNSVALGSPNIKIFTDYEGRHFNLSNRNRNRIQKVEIPLSYIRKKAFYVPKYENVSGKFFQEYGVIDWKPNLISMDGDDIQFTVAKPEVDFQVIVEGVASDGTLIHERHFFSSNH